ncbi:UDP-N-acetylglucosamine transferase subunit ALG14 homolog [Strongylocentrotus purpuratus]|uniref:UDP-N-acetylglucosamine transferase subunit ALG14 n=1 Tax=Strongylocentrotus purpuratus TaxID=7668 RepID=A0A7M7PHY3_STRPU|nr:UDP-N-acetylglucosamine transferase subunit ALG14 homolog [Strongylocentrotus purpuratus]
MAAPTNVSSPMFVIGFLCLFVVICLFRLLFVMINLGKIKTKHPNAVKTLIVAGSGGHTTEVIRLLGSMSDVYSPRVYVYANTDKISEDKIRTFEESKTAKGDSQNYIIEKIPRSREVRQSYLTSTISTLYATLFAFSIIFKHSPDLLLVNGPGTCIPLCAAAFAMRFLGVKPVIQVYVESICRVEYLSLSGLIMYYFADHLVVQWPSLKEKYPKAVYLGRVV